MGFRIRPLEMATMTFGVGATKDKLERAKKNFREDMDELTYSMSPRERELAQMEYDYVIRKIKETGDFSQAIANLTGYKKDPESGQYVQMTRDEHIASLDSIGQEDYKLYEGLQQRYGEALGTLGVSDPILQKQRDDEFRELKARAAASGNPIIGDTPETAVALTRAGARKLADYNEHLGIMKQQELNLGTERLMGFRGMMADTQANKYGSIMNYLNRDASTLPNLETVRGIYEAENINTLQNEMFKFKTKSDQINANVDRTLNMVGTIMGRGGGGGGFNKQPTQTQSFKYGSNRFDYQEKNLGGGLRTRGYSSRYKAGGADPYTDTKSNPYLRNFYAR